MTQYNLGTIYLELPTGGRAANVAQSIECYTEALRSFAAADDLAGYSRTQTAWAPPMPIFLPGTGRLTWPRAIECYTEALRFCTAEADPSGYAMIQRNLGDTYLELPTGDGSVDVALVIECYTEALRIAPPRRIRSNTP